MMRIILFLICAIVSTQTVSAAVVRVADGDCSGLSGAVAAAASSSGTTTILLARNGTYSACGISENAGNVVIDGQGATLKFLTASINAGASLTLRNASISSLANNAIPIFLCAIVLNDLGGFAGETRAICNGGTLIFESVSVHNLVSSGVFTNPNPLPYSVQLDGFIQSTGTLVFRNVTFSNNGGPSLFVTSAGVVEIYNSTIAGNISPFFLFYTGPAANYFPANPGVKISNSLLTSNAGAICSNGDVYGDPVPMVSLGGNVATESSCGVGSGTGDKIVQDASLGSFGDHGGLVPTQAIDGSSPAKGAGVAQYCEALDARGYTRSPHGCDAGAYEYGGGSGALTASGLNGFYYDPDANGHYVSLQRIHDNGDIAIVWSTFDANGNQAWVYGVGQLTGKRIHATMSQNLGGVLQPGGAPTGSSVHPWGTVDIDLSSCALAQFSYTSSVPGFGSGVFPLTRLAFVSDFGCSD